MEKVWEELKKIDAQADQIQSNAKEKAKKITLLAKTDAEKLVSNGKIYAEEEALKLNSNAVQAANQKRIELLTLSSETAAKLKAHGEKRLEQAVLKVVNAVLEENRP